MESITLYYKQGSSDKVYQANITQRDGMYTVGFAYGRRGTTLTTGQKTSTPVGYTAARAIYDKLVQAKMAKGYSPGEESSPVLPVKKVHSGIHCQLLNPLEESQLEPLLRDAAYWMQEKHDGRRLLLQKKDGVVTGINRLGFTVSVPEPINQAALAYPGDFLIDGEAVGDVLHAFDILSHNGCDIRSQGYAERCFALRNLLAAHPQRHIRWVRTACLPLQKRAMLEKARTANNEGIVLKRLDAPYTAGRPASGGSQFKFKFCKSASCIVGKINAKRSVGLEMLDGDRMVSVGNVTIPPNKAIPAVGSVVECRYLYAFREGSLFQPVYLGQRDDIPLRDCVITQLKYKEEAYLAAA